MIAGISGLLRGGLAVDSTEEELWLATAARVARRLPLAISPFTQPDDDFDLYKVIDEVASELAGREMREAQDQLDRWFELQRTAHPADLPAPCDSANQLYTPQIDAAYFIGLAVGVRLGRALDGHAAGATKAPGATEGGPKGGAR